MQSNPETVCRTCPVMPPETRTEEGALPTSEIEATETKQRLARRVVSEDNVFIMTSIMRDVIKSGTGRKAMSLKRNDLAGKTGTTNNFRDAWFSGFNQDVVSTVWVGFDQPADLGRGEAGSRASLPIWIDYMRVALTGIEEKPLTPPDSIVRTYVHKATGRPVAAGNPDAYPEYFIVGTVPEADRNRIPENSDNRGTGGGTITETLF